MSEGRRQREWTLMFYFASDNSLASAVVSQLKAIKDAGFHKDANVIAYFDPQPLNTPSHVFDVNLVEKLKRGRRTRFSFEGNDPFVRNLVFDRLWTEKDNETKESLREFLNAKGINYESETIPTTLTGEQSPLRSLHEFLTFCRTKFRARHYMLFILGHGVVVGNDIFLFDENVPEVETADPSDSDQQASNARGMVRKPVRNSLTLKDLGDELEEFNKAIREHNGKLELLGLHSCSMSGLEVAYEIQGNVKYMLASQGPAFVGSWPYKQILTRLFNDLAAKEDNSKPKLKNRLTKIFSYCVKNSYDFQLAGYSFDMALCDLSILKKTVDRPIDELSAALISGLKQKKRAEKELVKELILLAHWDAQSFWQEQYTDLYDFCFRFNLRSKNYVSAHPAVRDINTACKAMMRALKRGHRGDDDRLIVRSEFIGPLFQYSHGLSVFFPWSEPADKKFLERYAEYRFTADFEGRVAWRDFLNTYFVETKRDFHMNEKDELDTPAGLRMEDRLLSVLQKVSNTISSNVRSLELGDPPKPPGNGSKGPGDPTGDNCSCPSIKNYPSSTDSLGAGGATAVYEAPLGPNFIDQIDAEQFE